MARELATRSEADSKLFSRIPSILAPYAGGVPSSLNQILAQATEVGRIETPQIPKAHYEFISPAGEARVMLYEDAIPSDVPEEPKKVSLVGMWLTMRTEDGFETPETEIWYTGGYGLPGCFEGTSTEMHLSVKSGGKRSTAMLIIDPSNSVPARLCSQRFGMQEAVLQDDCTAILPGEQADPIGMSAYEDVRLLGVEGLNTNQGFLAFNLMGRNKAGDEKPVPIVVPNRVTVC